MQDPTTEIKSAEAHDRNGTTRVLSVLVVDDDAETSQVVDQMLKELGHDSVMCGHAQEAITLVQSRKFDLILVDYRMPELTGLDLVSMLRLDGCEIPVLMMTGYLETKERLSPKQCDVSDILKKPITLPQLAESIEKVFGPHGR